MSALVMRSTRSRLMLMNPFDRLESLVGLGAGEKGEDVIVLYLRTADVRGPLPAEIEGVAVITEVTGRITAY